MHKLVIYIFLCLGITSFSQPHGKLLITNYGQLEIGSESGAFWSIVKDKRGILYFGGEGEIFEFDGISWRGIPIPNRSAVRSLAIDTAGIIYVGGVGEFGYLMPDQLGQMKYYSLIPKVPKNKLMFPDIWSINIIEDQVFFQADNRLFCYMDDQIKTWELKNSYHRSFAINNQIILNQREIGLTALINDSLILLPGGSFFKDMIVSSMFRLDENKILIGTRTNGLFIYESLDKINASITPFECEANIFLKENNLYHGLNIPDHRMVFATLLAGVIIVDNDGKIINYINKSSGFIDYTSYYVNVFNDCELWIASAKGVGFHNINSPLSYWNDEFGLKGFINCIIEHDKRLYVGTNSGLYTPDLNNFVKKVYKSEPTPFKLYDDLNTEVWGLLKFDPTGQFSNKKEIQVLAATGQGLYNIIEKKIVFENKVNGVVTFCQSKKNPSILYFNTHPTFYILQYYDNKWNIVWQKNISSYVLSIVEDKKGNVWLGTKFYGVFRINMADSFKNFNDNRLPICQKDITDFKIQHFNTLSGLPNLNVCMVFIYNNNLIISCEGLFTYDEINNRFIRAEIFGEEVKKWNRTVYSFKEDIYGNIWGIETEVLDKQANGAFSIIKLPYQMLTARNSTLDYYHEDNGITWIGGDQGLFKYDSRFILPYQKNKFYALIRKVSLNNDSVIFYGTNYKLNESTNYTSFLQPDLLVPKFSVKNKTISFEFSCPYFQDDIPLEYSYFLEGYEDNWSEWSRFYKKEYNNLRENTYVFHLRARNNAGLVSNEATYKFIIDPPWYRTIVAYISFVLLFVLIMYASFKWYSYRLRRYNIVLEKTVHERTLILEKQKEEINDQAEKLKEQNEKLVHQKNRMAEMSKEIKETNKSKLQFFTNISHELRTPLSLILGPIEELLKPKYNLSEKDKTNFYNVIHRNASRLLSLVNQILDFRKIEIQTPKVEAIENDIVSFIEDISTYFKELAIKKEIEFAFETEEKKLKTWFDPDKIEKIIFNLISNAFKYTPRGGKIYINMSVVDNHGIEGYHGKAVKISVQDTGVGIEEDVIPKIFDRYYHSGRSVSFDQAGSGIGLSMAAKLVEIHHGKITLESKINVGSTFSIFIPLGREYLTDDEIKKEDTQLKETSDFIKSKTSEFRYINAITTDKSPDQKPDSDKDLILIVEDSEDIRFFIKNSLKKKYSFIEAENGVEGLKLAEKYIPDLIITDIMMPQMDGYELCSALKSNVLTSHIPVVMLTSKSGVASQKIGLEKGADDYVSKPFNITLLDTRISNLIKSRSELRKRFSKEIVIKPSDVVINSTDEKFLTKAIKIVENHMTEPEYDIETFSRDMAMSQSTLYRKLKALTGESTNNFIKDLRLKRAASLLSQNEISVSEIANMVGFDDPAYFSKSFKQKFGLPPTDYSKKFL